MDDILFEEKNKHEIKVKIDSEYSSILHLFFNAIYNKQKMLRCEFKKLIISRIIPYLDFQTKSDIKYGWGQNKIYIAYRVI